MGVRRPTAPSTLRLLVVYLALCGQFRRLAGSLSVCIDAYDPESSTTSSGFAGVPVGAKLDYFGATPPDGWIFADGKTIGSAFSPGTSMASDLAKELFVLLWTSTADAQLPVLPGGRGASALDDWTANKAITIPDHRGRASVGRDDMGGSAAGRTTAAGSGLDGAAMCAAGGSQLEQAHTHSFSATTSSAGNHNHENGMLVWDANAAGYTSFGSVAQGTHQGYTSFNGDTVGVNRPYTSTQASHAHSVSGTTASSGTGSAQNVQPSLVCNVILKVYDGDTSTPSGAAAAPDPTGLRGRSPVGSVVDFVGTVPPEGWLLADGRTIGNAFSGATAPNGETDLMRDLFRMLWQSFGDAQAPVAGGRGASDTADWLAGKTIALPDYRGRVSVGHDPGGAAGRTTAGGSGVDAGVPGATGGDENMHAHSHSLSGSTSSAGSHSHYMFSNQDTNYGASGDRINACPTCTVPYSGSIGDPHDYLMARGTAGASLGRTGSEGAHSHSLSGSAASAGAGSAQNVQPSLVATKIIKAYDADLVASLLEDLPSIFVPIIPNIINQTDIYQTFVTNTDNSTFFNDESVDNSTLISTAPIGTVLDWVGLVPPEGWLLADGKSIGDAGSGATATGGESGLTRDLFKLLWESLADAQAAVLPGGRGAAEAADWAAGKTIALPDLRGRTTVGHDPGGAAGRTTAGGSGVDSSVPGATGGDEDMQSHSHTLSGSTSSAGSHSHGNGQWWSQFGNVHYPYGIYTTRAGNVGRTVETNNGDPLNMPRTSSDGAHTHSLSGSAASAGAGGAQNVQPSAVLTKIIKAWDSTTVAGLVATMPSIFVPVTPVLNTTLISTAPVGTVVDWVGVTPPEGWLLADGRTIGNVGSGATAVGGESGLTRDLFKLLWESHADAEAAVLPGGRGATEALDWSFGKTIALPDTRGRTTVGHDPGGAAGRTTQAGSGVDSATRGAAGGDQAMHAHSHTLSGSTASAGSHNHAGGDYYATSVNMLFPHGVCQTLAGGTPHQISWDVNSNAALEMPCTSSTGAHSHSLSGSASSTGSGAAQNVQPSYVATKIIKAWDTETVAGLISAMPSIFVPVTPIFNTTTTNINTAPVGTVLDWAGLVPPEGWLLADGSTIGDAFSGATAPSGETGLVRDLFKLLWESFADAQAAVPGGRGATEAADWAAGKTIALPDLRGRTTVGRDPGGAAGRTTAGGSGVDSATMGAWGGDEYAPAHTHSLSGSTSSAGSHFHENGMLLRTDNAGNYAIHGSTSHGSHQGFTEYNGGTLATSRAHTNSAGSHSHSLSGSAASAGSGSAENVQPSVVLTKIIKAWDVETVAGLLTSMPNIFTPISNTPVGKVDDFFLGACPAAYVECDGAAISRTTYAALYAAIGAFVGVGDGSTTFNTPDMRGRARFGYDPAAASGRLTTGTSGVDSGTVGAAGGDQAMHGHSHALSGSTSAAGSHDHVSGGKVQIAANAGIYGYTGTLGSTSDAYATSGAAVSYRSHLTDTEAAHTHSLSGSAASAGAGSSQNVPPAMVVRTCIYAGA